MNRRPLALLSLLVLAAGLAAVLAVTRPARASVAVGQPAPPFALQGVDGKTYSLKDYQGKLVVLEWINPDCPFSRRHAEEKTMTELAASHPDVVWLAINSSNPSSSNFLPPAEHRAYDQQHGITYPVLYDESGAVGHAYGARTTPHMFIIDRQGKIAYEGAIDDDPGGREPRARRTNYVEKGLAAEAAGRAPDPALTKPYGCSVKY
jgi:alkyl hydroperoxide reductase subunit AhpC